LAVVLTINYDNGAQCAGSQATHRFQRPGQALIRLASLDAQFPLYGAYDPFCTTHMAGSS
jgi:hypothetical protein